MAFMISAKMIKFLLFNVIGGSSSSDRWGDLDPSDSSDRWGDLDPSDVVGKLYEVDHKMVHAKYIGFQRRRLLNVLF